MEIVELVGAYLTAVSIFVAIYLARRTIDNERKIANENADREHEIAKQQAKNERKVAADQATLDFIVSHEISSPEWSKICSTCDAVLSDPNRWRKLFKNDNNKGAGGRDRELELTILTYLNHYEIVAIAIDRGIISEDMYAMWFKDAYVKSWKKSEKFISHLKTIKNSETLYCEFCNLATRWSDNSDNT